ncbi:rhomboid family intramembrane serine protease [Planctomycetes bacterium Pla163]|uniref:rhomboid family intramembrane serine protease n=1 Tax=Rohdeia mirabilis TaxID=2528008 RepID=UPI0011A2EE31
MTTALAAAAAGIFILSQMPDAGTDWDSANWLGHYGLHQIWDGAWWGYLTAVFPHVGVLHLVFNLYWLWALGGELERRLGSVGFLGLAAATAFAASGFEIALMGRTGVGLSGIGYGLFGYFWMRSRFDREFQLAPQIVQLFVIWGLLCIPADLTGLMPIANLAHGGGLVAGVAIAASWHGRPVKWRLGGGALLVLVFAIATLPFHYLPWSAPWLRHEGLRLQVLERNLDAIDLYTRALELEPDDPWTLHNRGVAYQDVGDHVRAAADFARANELDPTIGR